MKPFRWNLKKKEQLGGLLKGHRHYASQRYHNELRVCSAQVLGRSDNRRMVFIGRSPQNIFDYLSGALQNTPLEDRIDILNISNRNYGASELARKMPASYTALKKHFTALGIAPKQLIASKRGICFVDLVCDGFTFDNVYEFIAQWCRDEQVDKAALWKKVKFLGITIRTKNSPNTHRWYQHAVWLEQGDVINAQSISLRRDMWKYMGDFQSKSSNTQPPETWNEASMLLPPREKERLEALRFAYYVYNCGLQEKSVFARELACLPEYKQAWLRDAALRIKRSKA